MDAAEVITPSNNGQEELSKINDFFRQELWRNYSVLPIIASEIIQRPNEYSEATTGEEYSFATNHHVPDEKYSVANEYKSDGEMLIEERKFNGENSITNESVSSVLDRTSNECKTVGKIVLRRNYTSDSSSPATYTCTSDEKPVRNGIISEKCTSRKKKKKRGRPKKCTSDTNGVVKKTVDKKRDSTNDGKSKDFSENVYICETCGKSFRRRDHCRRHMKLHTNEKPFECDVCGKCFVRRDHRNRHRESHKEVEPPVCEVCGKTFCNKDHSTEILRIIGEEKPYQCEICRKSFSRKDHLKRHVLIHSAEKNYVCDTCGRHLSHKGSFIAHVKSHNVAENPFACHMCGKNFATEDRRDKHVKSHYYDRPYRCTVCSKTYNRKEHFARHMHWHSSEKLYTCLICGKDVSNKGSLISHVKSHANKKSYNCDVCGKAFGRRSHRDRHAKIHTRIQNGDVSAASNADFDLLFDTLLSKAGPTLSVLPYSLPEEYYSSITPEPEPEPEPVLVND